MPVRLFVLRGVPDDEADEIRDLLDKNGIDYYETPPGKWGISAGAMWLRDASRHEEARLLIAEYQRHRAVRMREEYEKLKRAGKNKTLIDKIKEDPIVFLIVLAALVLVIYLSTKPFLSLGR